MQFMSIDIVLMESIFMYRLGFSFYHFLFSPNPGSGEAATTLACDISERHIKAFLAPYYILIMVRFFVYFLVIKYADLLYDWKNKQ